MIARSHRALKVGGRWVAPPGVMGVRLTILIFTVLVHLLIVAVIVTAGRNHPEIRRDKTSSLTVITLLSQARPTLSASSDHRNYAAVVKPQPVAVSSDGDTDAVAASGPEVATMPNSAVVGGTIQREAPAPILQVSSPGIAVQSVRDAYTRELWKHIAERRPRGIRLVGTTIVTFHIDVKGEVLSSEVSKSSGNFNLDKIALRAVRQASPFPAPPASLSAEGLMFAVPIIFH